MKYIVIGFMLLILNCEKSALSEEFKLEGQWILQKAVCFCNFENYDIDSNQLWFLENRILISKGEASKYVGISPINKTESYVIRQDTLTILSNQRQYLFTISND